VEKRHDVNYEEPKPKTKKRKITKEAVRKSKPQTDLPTTKSPEKT
jgi:hypothetical protein